MFAHEWIQVTQIYQEYHNSDAVFFHCILLGKFRFV